MAVTANGTPYVESSDIVANYPGVSLALANHIDDNTGKILQLVRATDVTSRITTSTTYVDTNFNITITPQKSDSAIIIAVFIKLQIAGATQTNADLAITDSSNNVIAEVQTNLGGTNPSAIQTTWAYSTPGTTSATTYKTRIKSGSGGISAISANDEITGQLYAIEVSA